MSETLTREDIELAESYARGTSDDPCSDRLIRQLLAALAAETARADREAAALAVARSTLEESVALVIGQRDREAAARQEAERQVEYYREQTGRMLRARYDDTAMDAQERALAAEAERDRLRAELAALRGEGPTT